MRAFTKLLYIEMWQICLLLDNYSVDNFNLLYRSS